MTLLRRYSCDRPKPSASLVAVQESGPGTFRTWPVGLTMSAHVGKADFAAGPADFRVWHETDVPGGLTMSALEGTTDVPCKQGHFRV